MPNTVQTVQPKVRGKWTKVNLAQTTPFFAAPEPDAWGHMRTPFSQVLARMSLELAAEAYDLRVDRFLDAGWTDCTFQLENRVLPLCSDRLREKRLHMIESGFNLYRAKLWMRTSNPMVNMVRAVQQFQATDTGKAIVMARPLPDGRTVVALSFIGTSRKFYDWFSNLKFQLDRGLHRGFMALAHQFEQHAGAIHFPETAARMGCDTLTMRDVLEAMRHPASPFKLWITGHSQGAAVAQTFLHLLKDQQVLDEHIFGYAIASPKVAAVGAVPDPAAYALYHLISTDDPITCMGAQVRLGMDLVFQPDDVFRAAYYGWPVSGKRADAMEFIARPLREMQTAESTLIGMAGLLHATQLLPDAAQRFQTFFQMLQRVPGRFFSDNALSYANGGFARLEERLHAGYVQYMGANIPDEAMMRSQIMWQKAIEAAGGFDAFMEQLRAMLVPTHSIGGMHGGLAPYTVIMRKCLPETTCGVWQKDLPARCLAEDGTVLLPLEMPQTLHMTRTALASQHLAKPPAKPPEVPKT